MHIFTANYFHESWSNRGLPSFARTNKPPSPLEILKSSSRYVVKSQDAVLSPGIGTLRGGWPEILRAMLATAPCRGFSDCWIGDRLIFCPKISISSGRFTVDDISGGWKVPSLNFTCIIYSISISIPVQHLSFVLESIIRQNNQTSSKSKEHHQAN